MATKAHGRILGWEGGSLWIFGARAGERYPRTDPHAHHALQLTIALTGEVEFHGDAGRVSGVAFAIAPDARHAFAGTGTVAHLFVASEGQAGREIARALFERGPIAPVPLGSSAICRRASSRRSKTRGAATTICARSLARSSRASRATLPRAPSASTRA
ncbi:MAG: hypothetical protein U0414_25245 [Polyangiaceae bacterium]